MSLEQIVVWIVVGGIRLNLVGRVIVGIFGAFLGGSLFGLLNIRVGSGFISDAVTAFGGAVVLLVVLRTIRRR